MATLDSLKTEMATLETNKSGDTGQHDNGNGNTG